MRQVAVWSLDYYDRAAKAEVMLAVVPDQPATRVSRIQQEAFNKSTAERSESSFDGHNLTSVSTLPK